MKVLVRAIVTGFGLSVGAFVFRKLSAKYNLEPAPAPAPNAVPVPATPNGSVPTES